MTEQTQHPTQEKLSLREKLSTILRAYKDYRRIYREVIKEQKAKDRQRRERLRANKLIKKTEIKSLSLDEMLNLAEKVESWEYVPRHESLFGSVVEIRYRGTVKGSEITVGERALTPWFGQYRYIEVKYGNLCLGEFPPYKDFKTDERLENFYKKIPTKIRQQGLDAARKIKGGQK